MIRVAAVQMESGEDRARNLEVAERRVREAAAQGAALVVLPEMFNLVGPPEVRRAGGEPLDGPTGTWAAGLAAELGLHLLAGSVREQIEGEAQHFNTSCLYDPEGRRVALYRKIHLFDCDFPGAAFLESEGTRAGDGVRVVEAAGVRLGLSICYDLRFPELFRALALGGAEVVALPAAFTERTGRDHWEVLVRARAIEEQVFMVAAGQVGAAARTMRWFGRSMIVDPWGLVLAQAPDRECVILADLDLAAMRRIRATMPVLAHRRPERYRLLD